MSLLEELMKKSKNKYTLKNERGDDLLCPYDTIKEFVDIYNLMKDLTVVTKDRCYFIYNLLRQCLPLYGDIAECGVFKGGSSYLIADTTKSTHKKLHLFDTFSGMPELASEEIIKGVGIHGKGEFLTTIEEVKTNLSKFSNIKYHQGIIPETFEEVKNTRFSFVYIDVDLYRTVKDSCKFFYKKMSKSGIMLFDDYGLHHYEHTVKKAIDEFFEDKKEVPIILNTGQCFVIKH